MIWNEVDAGSAYRQGVPLENGAPADDVWGEPSFTSELFPEFYYFSQVHDGRYFVQRRHAADVIAFDPPLSTTDYALCIYDANSLVLDAIVPAGSAWQAGLHGFKYKSRSGTPDGVTQIQFKVGADGKAKVLVQGKGGDLGMPALDALVQPLRVQLRSSDGRCWEAVYSAPPKKGASAIFSDRAD